MLIPSRLFGFLRVRLNGRFGVTVPNFGTGGDYDNPLLNDVEAGDEAAGVEFVLIVPAQFGSGVLALRTDGALSFTGAADGTYSQSTPLYVYTPGDAAPVRRYVTGTTDPTLTIAVGATSVTSTFNATGGSGTLSALNIVSPVSAAAMVGGSGTLAAETTVAAPGVVTSTFAGTGGSGVLSAVVAVWPVSAAALVGGSGVLSAVSAGVSFFVMPDARNLIREPAALQFVGEPAEMRTAREPAETRFIPR